MEDKNDILLKQLFEQAAQQQIEDNGFTEWVMMNLPEVKESRVPHPPPAFETLNNQGPQADVRFSHSAEMTAVPRPEGKERV